ncbi:hypothetical protein [Kordiimonas sp.]|uniref:hypothetical protein n=1 Tax=Kordiimonas sp. TaxID=1970157 RepID=UPI003A918984
MKAFLGGVILGAGAIVLSQVFFPFTPTAQAQQLSMKAVVTRMSKGTAYGTLA